MPFDFDKDISDGAKAWMKLLGNFTPTVLPERRELKGYVLDENGESGNAYYDSGELRELAAACSEVADWLDKRAGGQDE